MNLVSLTSNFLFGLPGFRSTYSPDVSQVLEANRCAIQSDWASERASELNRWRARPWRPLCLLTRESLRRRQWSFYPHSPSINTHYDICHSKIGSKVIHPKATDHNDEILRTFRRLLKGRGDTWSCLRSAALIHLFPMPFQCCSMLTQQVIFLRDSKSGSWSSFRLSLL